MNIIIPLGGLGSRFSKIGYKDPKPLIKIYNKYLLEMVIDNLYIKENDKIFILYNINLEKYNFVEIITNLYKNKKEIIFIKIINNTEGAAETLNIGINNIIQNHTFNKKTIVIDCDTVYTTDILDLFRNHIYNMVYFTCKDNEQPIYSYIEINNGFITNIAEKNKISNNANTGAYCFQNIYDILKYSNIVIDNKIKFNNEYYTSCIIKTMIQDNILFTGNELNSDKVISLGTPHELNTFLDKTNVFLFDLDGTLVITDDIYYWVWSDILNYFNIVLTKEIYTNFILGNSDKFVLNSLLKNIKIDLHDLSNKKDELFKLHINKIKKIDGIIEFIQFLHYNNHKLAIITNCNNNIAVLILKYLNIYNYFDIIISADMCKNNKPFSEPYIKGLEYFNIDNSKAIIFEDSKSGLLSATSINPKCLIGIQTIYNEEELLNYGCNFTIKNYYNYNILYNNIIEFKNNYNIDKYIINSLKYHNINFEKNIKINQIKMKGGNIADVLEININNNNYIAKIENKLDNTLSIMANKLELYNREYYFYNNIAPFIPVKIPKLLANIYNDENKQIGFVLENLFSKGFVINLDLNKENIQISLNIIEKMCKLHIHFNNKNLESQFINGYLKKNNSNIFKPFLYDFIVSKINIFKIKWAFFIDNDINNIIDNIVVNFNNIQEALSNDNLTLVHGDIKSPNIFYDINNNYEPWFIDWQHCVIGKGVQDLIFFIIESFNINNIEYLYPLFINYYYKILVDNNINYLYTQYIKDINYALCYIPFFTAVWFGSMSMDEQIDKNWIYFFIQKLFFLFKLNSKYILL